MLIVSCKICKQCIYGVNSHHRAANYRIKSAFDFIFTWTDLFALYKSRYSLQRRFLVWNFPIWLIELEMDVIEYGLVLGLYYRLQCIKQRFKTNLYDSEGKEKPSQQIDNGCQVIVINQNETSVLMIVKFTLQKMMIAVHHMNILKLTRFQF